MIGLDLIQCLKASGISRLIATAKYDFQAKAAREAGAAEVIMLEKGSDPVKEVLQLTGGTGADQVYEGVGGKTDIINQAIEMCRVGGRIVMTGIFDGKRPIDLLTLLLKEIPLLSSNSYSYTGMKRDYQIAVDLLTSGQVRHDFLVTHRFPLSEFRRAVDTAFDKKESHCLRAVFIHEKV